MRFQPVNCCPVNGGQGELAYSNIGDWFFGTDGLWSFYRDAKTGHLWLHPRPHDEEIRGLYSNYYTHSAEEDIATSTWDQAVALVLHRSLGYPAIPSAGLATRILSRLPSVKAASVMEVCKLPSSAKGRLLDFGCGSGRFMHRMNVAGWEVVGVEPDQKAAEALRVKYGYEVRISLDESAGWEGYFDVVVANHVIEHIADPVWVLHQLSRLLVPGGQLLLTTPNAIGLGLRLFGCYWRGLEAPRHLNIFTPQSIEVALRMAGLVPIVITTESRLARGIFFTSALAAFGQVLIERDQRGSRRLLKFAGYLFQVIEDILMRINRTLGEEIFCCAYVKNLDHKLRAPNKMA